MSQFHTNSGGVIPPVGTVAELDGNIGTATPVAGIINVVGVGTAPSGLSTSGNIITSASGNTLTIYETKAQDVTGYIRIDVFDSPYTALDDDYYISVDSSGGGVTVLLPNAPNSRRMFLIKDALGTAAINNITITTPGLVVLFDGATSYVLDTPYEAVLFTFNNTSYEAF
jgi:hypothetical protein